MYNKQESTTHSMTAYTVLMIGLTVIFAVWTVQVGKASIPDPSGVIHACYDPGKQTLRVIDTQAGEACRPQEMALLWNQTGPQGPEGPRGPSDGFVTSLRGGPGTNVDEIVDVLSLSLPTGDYMLSASARVQRDRAGTSRVVCDIAVAGGPFQTGYVERLDGIEDVATIAATNGVSLDMDTMVHLRCFSIGDEGSLVTHADLTAIKVGMLTRK